MDKKYWTKEQRIEFARKEQKRYTKWKWQRAQYNKTKLICYCIHKAWEQGLI